MLSVVSEFAHRTDLEPKVAIAVRLISSGGIGVVIGGIRNFDLTKEKLQSVVKQVAEPNFEWRYPRFGPMQSSLTIAVEEAETVLVFVLDDQLNAVFSHDYPPLFVGDKRSEAGLFNAQCWDDGACTDGPRIASVITSLDNAGGEGNVRFNMAVDSIGEVGGERYRTPIIIDPDVPWPQPHPPGGGHGG